MSSLPVELVEVPVADADRDRPELASLISGTGIRVPERLFGGSVFRADREARVLTRPDGTCLVRFGACRLWGALCLDPATGAVIDIWDYDQPAFPRGERPEWREGLTNSSIDKFIETAKAVTDRFPYYGRWAFETDDGYAEVENAYRDLVRIITEIDPPAAIPDRFWSTFTDDVMIGDFATEDDPE